MKQDSTRVFAWAALAATGIAAGVTPQVHAQEQLWMRQFGTVFNEWAYALAPDGAGGVMVAGTTTGSLGGTNPVIGSSAAFLARYDGAGDRLWIGQFGTGDHDQAYALASDGAGGVMVAGETWGDLGAPNLGAGDVFLARYDAAGTRLWIEQFGTSGYESAFSLAPDGAGGVMVAGFTAGNLAGSNAGGRDVFLARYDSAGNQLWIRQFGTSGWDSALSLAPDGTGGVMVAGFTGGDLSGPSAGFNDVFLARYDSAGVRLWIRQFGTSGNEEARALAPDGAGGVMVAGYTSGDLGGGGPGGSIDAFLARYDSAGNELWIRQFGTSGLDRALALASDGEGGVMVAGSTRGSLGGPNAGGDDAFIAHYSSAGSQLWIRQFGTNRNDHANALAPDGADGVMVAGDTGGDMGGPSEGRSDAFLANYAIAGCPCACDFDTSTGPGVCDIVDFTDFAGRFTSGDPCACDIDTSTGVGVCDIVDFVTFAGQFAGGCP